MTIQFRLGLHSMTDLAPHIMRAVDAEIEDAAEELQYLAQELAPVRTGALRDSIHVQRIDHLAVQVRADAEYAAFVEYGTSRMAAQPFMTPAMETIRQSYAARIARAIEAAID